MAASEITVRVGVEIDETARKLLEAVHDWQGNCAACGHRYSRADACCSYCGSPLPATAASIERPAPLQGDVMWR